MGFDSCLMRKMSAIVAGNGRFGDGPAVWFYRKHWLQGARSAAEEICWMATVLWKDA